MKFAQSRWQSIVYRFKIAFLGILVLCTITWIFHLFGFETPTTSFVSTYILASLGLPAVFTLWLILFNSGASRIDEYYVEFTDKEFCYGHFARCEVIPWSDFKEYKVKGFFTKSLHVYAVRKSIDIDLSLFTKAQQVSILKALEEKS